MSCRRNAEVSECSAIWRRSAIEVGLAGSLHAVQSKFSFSDATTLRRGWLLKSPSRLFLLGNETIRYRRTQTVSTAYISVVGSRTLSLDLGLVLDSSLAKRNNGRTTMSVFFNELLCSPPSPAIPCL